MMRAWTELLPHVVFAWIARRQCQVMDQRAPIGRVVEPRPGVVLRVPAERAWGDEQPEDEDRWDEIKLVMLGDGRWYDSHGGEWELSEATYAERTKDCPCEHCVARRAAAARPFEIGQRDEGGCRDA